MRKDEEPKYQDNTWNKSSAIYDDNLVFGKYGIYAHILGSLTTVPEDFASLSSEEKSHIIKDILNNLCSDVGYKVGNNDFAFICELGDTDKVQEGIKKLIASNAKRRVMICNSHEGVENIASVIQEQINSSAMQEGEYILCVAYHWLYPNYVFRVFIKN